MAFKTIDWGKLAQDMAERTAMTPEERAADDARADFERRAPKIAADEAKRDAGSTDLLIVKLAEIPDVRFDRQGDPSFRLYFENIGTGGVKSANYAVSEAEQGQDVDAIRHGHKLRSLDKGSTVTLLGSWQNRNWKDAAGAWHSRKEFQAERYGVGALSREDLMKRAPGGIAERAEAFVASKEGRAGVLAQASELVASRGPSAGDRSDLTRFQKGPAGPAQSEPDVVAHMQSQSDRGRG